MANNLIVHLIIQSATCICWLGNRPQHIKFGLALVLIVVPFLRVLNCLVQQKVSRICLSFVVRHLVIYLDLALTLANQKRLHIF
jgi:hypothetical protein